MSLLGLPCVKNAWELFCAKRKEAWDLHRKCVMPQARTGKQIRAGEDWNQRGLNSAILAEFDVI